MADQPVYCQACKRCNEVWRLYIMTSWQMSYRPDELIACVGCGEVCIIVISHEICRVQEVIREQVQTMVCGWIIGIG